MEASPLNESFIAAKAAALSHEEAMAAAVERVLNEAVDDSARRYAAAATALAAAGPHADEVFNGAKTSKKLTSAIGKSKKAAGASYTSELPSCIAGSALPLPAGLDRVWLRETLDRIDAEKLKGKNPRGLMDQIRKRAGMSPTKARKALEAEGGKSGASKAALAKRPMGEAVGDGYLYEEPKVDEDVLKGLIDEIGKWSEREVTDKAYEDAYSAIERARYQGKLVILRDVQKSSRIAAVANYSVDSKAITINKIGARGPVTETTLLRRIASDASKRGLSMEVRATFDTQPFYRSLGFEKQGRSNNFVLPKEKVDALATGIKEQPSVALAAPDASLLTSVAERNRQWDKAAQYLSGSKRADPRNQPPSKWKAEIANRLSDRLAGDPDWQDFVEFWRGGSEWGDAGMRVSSEETVRKLITSWATTSSDKHPMAQALQRAVKNEFGLSKKSVALSQHDLPQGKVDQLYKKYGSALQKFVRAMYEQTQEDLKAAGYERGDKLVLYRGMALPMKAAPFSASDLRTADIAVGRTEIGLQPASSYSISLQTASSFSADSEAGEAQMIFASEVPVERILGSARSGWGCLEETEFVVLGERAGVADEAVFAGVRERTPAAKHLYDNAHEFWDWVQNEGHVQTENVSGFAHALEPGDSIYLKDKKTGASLFGDVDKDGNIVVSGEEMEAKGISPKAVLLNNSKPYDVIVASGGRCDGIEINWDVKNPFFGKAYSVSAEKVTQITDTTRARIMKAVKDAYDNGSSVRDTAKAIEGLKGINSARARLIARTELTALVNGATEAAGKVIAEATGDPYSKQWLTAPGAEHPRHEDYPGLDGQTVGIDEVFDVGGTQLEFPGDPQGPADEVCNCRCTLLLIGPEGSEESEGIL